MDKLTYDDISLRCAFPEDANIIIDHICNLPGSDQYLRFGFYPTHESIKNYVLNSFSGSGPKDKGYWFIIYKDNQVIATLNVAFKSDSAEFGFTTQPGFRGLGLGQILFARGYQMVTEFGVSKIFMSMLSINKPMIHIAKKFGCAVMISGPEREASVTIEYPVSLKQIESVKNMIVDKSLFL